MSAAAVMPPRRVGRPCGCPVEVLERIVRLRAKGVRMVDICDAFNSEGIRTPGGNVRWRPSHLSRMLRTTTVRALMDEYMRQMQATN